MTIITTIDSMKSTQQSRFILLHAPRSHAPWRVNTFKNSHVHTTHAPINMYVCTFKKSI